MNLQKHLERQRAWSSKTFGPGARPVGICDHIRKELLEIEAEPEDLSEWMDVVILGFDGAWRSGHSIEAICDALQAKQIKNEGRTWPDWRTQPVDKAIEHVKVSGKCPDCGAYEVDAYTPRTVYSCGSSDYDQRPGTFTKGKGCA